MLFFDGLIIINNVLCAGVVELADARDSKSRDGNIVWVRPPPPAPKFKGSEDDEFRFRGFFYAFSVLFLCENPVLNNEKRAIIDKKRKSHDLKVGKRRKSINLFLIFFGACGTICVYTTAAPRKRRTKKCRRTNQTKEGNGSWINWC